MRLTWGKVGPRYWHLFFIYLLGILLSLLFSFFQMRMPKMESVLSAQENIADISPLSVILFILLVIASLLVSVWVKVALRYAVVQKKNLPLLQNYKKSWGIVLKFIWMTFLALAIIIPGIFFFIIPGLILMVFFWFVDWIVVTGEAKGLNALLMSRELLRGIFWRALWRAVAPWLISASISIVLMTTLTIALVVFYDYSEEMYSWIYTFSFAGVSIALMPFLFGYDYELYLILKNRAGKITINPRRRRKYKILAIVGVILCVLLIGPQLFLLSNH